MFVIKQTDSNLVLLLKAKLFIIFPFLFPYILKFLCIIKRFLNHLKSLLARGCMEPCVKVEKLLSAVALLTGNFFYIVLKCLIFFFWSGVGRSLWAPIPRSFDIEYDIYRVFLERLPSL